MTEQEKVERTCSMVGGFCLAAAVATGNDGLSRAVLSAALLYVGVVFIFLGWRAS